MKSKIFKTLKENSMIVFLLVLFFLIPFALRFVDNTSAAFDPGILHSVVLSCLIYAIFQACTWSILKVIWPDLGKYFINDFSMDYGNLNKRTKILISLGVYFFILLQLVLIVCAIL